MADNDDIDYDHGDNGDDNDDDDYDHGDNGDDNDNEEYANGGNKHHHHFQILLHIDDR